MMPPPSSDRDRGLGALQFPQGVPEGWINAIFARHESDQDGEVQRTAELMGNFYLMLRGDDPVREVVVRGIEWARSNESIKLDPHPAKVPTNPQSQTLNYKP
jgi:hypothetical protein